jgi:hypothetical protein
VACPWDLVAFGVLWTLVDYDLWSLATQGSLSKCGDRRNLRGVVNLPS